MTRFKEDGMWESEGWRLERRGLAVYLLQWSVRPERLVPSYAYPGQMAIVPAGDRSRERRILPIPGRWTRWAWKRLYS